MGGGDLNLKKSWHPNTLKNQKRVYEAEQANAAEKRKLQELQREIQHERNFEELKKIGQSSGVLAADDSKRLEWMYKGSENTLNREEYLTGRAIDKHFEQQDKNERQKEVAKLVGVTEPINHVEHECIPFSIRAFRGAPASEDQVDLQRKIMEDPLMMIKQREMETRQKLLQNPVKLKEIHRLLQADKKLKESSSHKKKKKSKNSHKKGSHSDSNDSDDLDSQLAKKYKKLLGGKSEQSAALNIDKLLHEKYEKLSSELDKIKKSKKKEKKSKSKKKKRDNSSSSDSSDSSAEKWRKNKPQDHKRYEPPMKHRFDKNNDRYARDRSGRSPQRNRFNRRSRSPRRNDWQRNEINSRYKNDRNNRFDNPRRHPNSRRRTISRQRSRSPPYYRGGRNSSISPAQNSSSRYKRNSSADRHRNQRNDNHRNERHRNSKSRSLSPKRKTKRLSRSRSRNRSNERQSRTQHRNESKSPEKPKISQETSKENDKCQTERAIRTVALPSKKSASRSVSSRSTSSRSSSSGPNSDDNRETSRNYGLVTAGGEKIEIKNDKKYVPIVEEKKTTSKFIPPQPKKKLTEEEKGARLREMQQNAKWHDKEQNISRLRYEEREKNETEQEKNMEFDRNYIHKEMHKALTNQDSVEARLKSNKNNIQRMSSSMHSHFARK